mgnify:CR=1 FL=1
MTQTDHFAKDIAFAWPIAFARWLIFKIVLFLEYLVFFRAVFCTEQLQCFCRMVFRMFLVFLNFDPNWPFCKGYSLGRWPIFKIVLFLEYLVFFRAVFCTKQLQWFCRMVFRLFLGFWIFDSNLPFCKGYSLCMGYSPVRWPICKIVSFLE